MVELHRAPAKAPATHSNGSSWLTRPRFRLQRKRTTQRIQTEQGIRPRNQRHFRNRHARNQIPAHHVAKGLIHPDPVHVDGKSLWGPQQRGGRIAPKVDVRLYRVTLRFIDVHTAKAPIDQVRKIESSRALEILHRQRLHRSRYLVERQFHARQRSDPHDV